MSFEQLPPPGSGWDAQDVRADAAVRWGCASWRGGWTRRRRTGSAGAGRGRGGGRDQRRAGPDPDAGRGNPADDRVAAGDGPGQAAGDGADRRGAGGGAVVAGLALGAWQYRSVMRPLGSSAPASGRVAAGQFRGRVETQGGSGGDEFARSRRDFNRMAAELDGLYHELEQKVAAKSKELVRSERLASVGYLAAGVAHEINNPLGIISGYAEYSLSELRERDSGLARRERVRRPSGTPTGRPTADAVRTRSRSRCRSSATRRSAARRSPASCCRWPGPARTNRAPVSLADVARQVASMRRRPAAVPRPPR